MRLTLAIILVLCAITFRQWFAVSVIGVFLLLTLFQVRFAIDRIGELIIALVCLGVTYVLTVVIGPAPKHPLSEAFALIQAFLCVWSLLYSCSRLFFSNPWGGQQATLLFALLGIFACGGNQLGRTYHVFVILFAFFSMWAMAQSDPSRPSLKNATTRRKMLLSGSVMAASVIAACLFVLLPFVYQKVTKQIRSAMLNQTQTGFNLYFRLGSLSRMLQSRRVVLRVEGPRRTSMHLRGMIYDRYYNKHWRVPQKTPTSLVRISRKSKKRASRWTIRYVSGEDSRYFVPLHSTKLSSPGGQVLIDNMGIVKPLPDQTPDSISFSLGTPLSLKLAKPRRDDLQVPRPLRRILRVLALRWTKGYSGSLQKLLRIQQHLRQDYTYSLSFKRPEKKEPILDFLLKNKQGHCEYFASAMALLARSIGVPVRVVGGYLVSEYNPLGGYLIVREQNAHSWVEAWVPGRGWRTFDPTPSDGVLSHMPHESSTMAGILDLIRVWFNRSRDWLLRRTALEMSGMIGLFVLVWIAIRLRRYFRMKGTLIPTTEFDYREPLPSFVAMLQTLQSSVAKSKSESLEHYALRLQSDDLPESAQLAAPLVMAYASFRYGRIGDVEELVANIDLWLSRYGIREE